MSHPQSRPSRLTYFLLFLAGAATLGTLKQDYSSSRSSEYTEWPRGESRQRLTVTLAPVEDRLASFNYSGDLHLQLTVKFVQDIRAADARWALTMDTPTGDPLSLSGGFPEFGGDVGTEDNGDITGDAIVRVGKLCPNNQPPTDGCLPCLGGCTLTLDADRCHPVGDHIESSEIKIARDDGSRFEARCEDGDNQQPCDDLRGWLSVEGQPLTNTICTTEDT